MNKTVLLINPTIQPVGVQLLARESSVVMAPDGKEDTIIRFLNDNRAQAVITRVEMITRRIFESCPSLAVVGQHGVGVDNIDVAAATDNGVVVVNVPAANYMSVAEHTMMAILALSRNLLVSDAKTRECRWEFRDAFYPMEVNGKTLVIVGLGKIGQEVARKARAFNMQLWGYDPYVNAEDMALVGVRKVEKLADCMPDADFVSLHVPLTPDTKHLISGGLLGLMKPTAYLINVGRGKVVDQAALCSALEKKVIAGAALDVLYDEPPQANDPLLTLENIIFTPHFAGDTREAKYRCSQTLATEVLRVLRGAGSGNIVNPRVLAVARMNSAESAS